MVKVLFVCLGNICRSPMAEGCFKHIIEKEGLVDKFFVDSAGTAGYHVGNLADARMRETAYSHGITLTSRSRQLVKQDLTKFDYIIAMDKSNYFGIRSLEDENSTAKVLMMREFDTEGVGEDVPDPYYGGISGFEEVYRILTRSNESFFNYLLQQEEVQ